MKKQLVTVLTAAILMMATSAMATQVTVTYNAANADYLSLAGTFAGNDVNNDGWLMLPELTDWTTIYGGGASFSALNDIGDFNYLNNIWVPNALQWNQYSQDAYMTWNNWSYSASTSNYNWEFITVVENNTPVPEPGTMMLLGLGMAGLVIYGKRRSRA